MRGFPMTDYATWRRDRLAELDAIDAQIRKLPPLIQSVMQNEPYQLRQRAEDLNWNDSWDRNRDDVGRWIERKITQLAAELARITVAPASDGGEK